MGQVGPNRRSIAALVAAAGGALGKPGHCCLRQAPHVGYPAAAEAASLLHRPGLTIAILLVDGGGRRSAPAAFHAVGKRRTDAKPDAGRLVQPEPYRPRVPVLCGAPLASAGQGAAASTASFAADHRSGRGKLSKTRQWSSTATARRPSRWAIRAILGGVVIWGSPFLVRGHLQFVPDHDVAMTSTPVATWTARANAGSPPVRAQQRRRADAGAGPPRDRQLATIWRSTYG